MKLHLPLRLLSAVMICCAAPTTTCAATPGQDMGAVWNTIFEDEFNSGALDESKWSRCGYDDKQISEMSCWYYMSTDDELVSFNDGCLILHAKYGDYYTQKKWQENGYKQVEDHSDTFACGGIDSTNKFTFKYGYVEIRAAYTSCTGAWPALWMLPKSGVKWPESGEIDIMEHLATQNYVYQTVHYQDTTNNDPENWHRGSTTITPELPGNVSDMHVYGMEWAADYIKFYLDGVVTNTILASSFTGANGNGKVWPFMDDEYYLILDQQITLLKSWQTGDAEVDQTALAQAAPYMKVDYVKVYQQAPLPIATTPSLHLTFDGPDAGDGASVINSGLNSSFTVTTFKYTDNGGTYRNYVSGGYANTEGLSYKNNSNYIRIGGGNMNFSKSFTLSMAVEISDSTPESWSNIFAIRVGDSEQVRLQYVDADRLALTLNNAFTNDSYFGTSLTSSAFSRLTLVYDATDGSIKMYNQGDLVKAWTYTTGVGGAISFDIGGNNANKQTPLYIDDVAIYDFALTAGQISDYLVGVAAGNYTKAPLVLSIPTGSSNCATSLNYQLRGDMVANTTATIDGAPTAGTVSLQGAIDTAGYKLIADGIGTLELRENTGVSNLQVNGGSTVSLAGSGSLAASGGVVNLLAADSTLRLEGDSSDIEVASSIIGTGSIVKLGSGRATLAALAPTWAGKLEVQAGSLALADGSTLELSSGRTLTLADGTSLDSALTLCGGVLELDASATTAASLNSKALTLSSLSSLILSNAPSEVNESTEIELLTGVSGVSGILWNGTGVVAATVFNGLSDELGEGILKLDGDTLKLSYAGVSDWTWIGGDGTWVNDENKDSEWDKITGTPAGKNLTFGDRGLDMGNDSDGLTKVTISGAVEPRSIAVNNTTGTYVFASDGTGSISGATGLTKTGDGELRLELINSATGTLLVEDGTVKIGSADTAGFWAGGIEVKGESVLELVKVSGTVDEIRFGAGATVTVGDGTTITNLLGLADTEVSGKLVTSGKVTIRNPHGKWNDGVNENNNTYKLTSVANTGENSVLSLHNNMLVQSLTNEGSMVFSDGTKHYSLLIEGGTKAGGNITADTITVKGDSTFGSVTVHSGLYANKSNLTFNGNSTITGILSQVANLTTNATTTLTSDNLYLEGNLNGTGSVYVTDQTKKAITVLGHATIGGNASATGDINLRGTGSHSIGGTLSSGGNITVNGSLSLSGGALTLNGGLAAVAGTLSGLTSVTLNGNLTKAATKETAAVTAATLTPGATLGFTITGGVDSLNVLNMSSGSHYYLLYATTLSDGATAPEVSLLLGDQTLKAGESCDTAGTPDTAGTTYTLIHDSATPGLVSIRVTMQGATEWAEAPGGSVWTSGAFGTNPAVNDSNIAQFGGTGVDDGSKAASITLSGSEAIVAGKVVVNNTATGSAEPVQDYVFNGEVSATEGADLQTGELSIQNGGLTLKADVLVSKVDNKSLWTGATYVGSAIDGSAQDAGLVVDEDGSLTTGSMYVYAANDSNDLQKGFTNKGTTVVTGALIAKLGDELIDINNTSGELSLGEGSITGVITGGTVTVREDATGLQIENLVGNESLVIEKKAQMYITAKEGAVLSNLRIAEEGGLLVQSPTDASFHKLSLAGAVDTEGTIMASELEITKAAAGSKIAYLYADALTLDLSAFTPATADAPVQVIPDSLLRTGNLSAVPGISTVVTETEMPTIKINLTGCTGNLLNEDYTFKSGLTTKTAEVKEAIDWVRDTFGKGGVYTLVDLDTVPNFDLTVNELSNWKQLFALAGLKLDTPVQDAENPNLVLKVTEGDLNWEVGTSWATNSQGENVLFLGGIVDTDTPNSLFVSPYDQLNEVDHVILAGNHEISLTDVDPAKNPKLDDSVSTDLKRGLTVRNLSGDDSNDTLKLIGDADDLATLINTGDSTLAGSVVLDGLKVQLESLTPAADDADGKSTLNVGSVTLSNGAVLDTTASVNGTDLPNGYLEVGQIHAKTSQDGTINGKVTITGSGGSYLGRYEQAEIELKNNASQTLAVGDGLSLVSRLEKTEAAMVALEYRAASLTEPAAVSAFELSNTALVLNNVDTANGYAMKTLKLTGNGSVIKDGSLTFGVNANDIHASANGKSAQPATVIEVDGASLQLDGKVIVNANQAGKVTGPCTFDLSKPTEGRVLFSLANELEFGDDADDEVELKLNGSYFNRYYTNGRLMDDGTVVADLITNHYSRNGLTQNGKAGMQLLDYAILEYDPQHTDMRAAYSDIAGVLDALDTYDAAAADKLAAAVGGAGTAVLGQALADDVERQLRAIRNRTTTMGVDQTVHNEDMPYFNAWINAEGDYRWQDKAGTQSGYTLSSWGGTVGFDVDCTEQLTAGLAFTAMYGDLETDGADLAKGDLDTRYLSAFAHVSTGRWTHTFVGTVGRIDATLDRTVNYGAGSYRTEGDTEALGFGLMYEVGYTIALNEDASFCLQPIANITWKHVTVDAYTEKGSDAALSVNEQEYDTVTFGLGARAQAVVGESIYNRTSILEMRALLKMDAGDSMGETEVGFVDALSSSRVNSAEMGALGAEIGMGLTIPIGSEGGNIFADASAEIRSGAANVNGTVGYRINF